MYWKWILICGDPAQVARVDQEMNGAFLTREGRIITSEMLVAAELANYVWDSEEQRWERDGADVPINHRNYLKYLDLRGEDEDEGN
ncbi:hypothetical protein GC175_17120 [bacterium]|nr:hypothetical protein [bacterium]